MHHEESSPLQIVKTILLAVTVTLFPIFFLPTTQEYYNTNKVYFVVVAALALCLVSLIEMIMSKKLIFRKKHLDTNILLVVASVVLSALITAPNKVMTLFNGVIGVLPMIALAVLAFYIARNKSKTSNRLFDGANIPTLLTSVTVFLGIISIVMFFQPFQKVTLPLSLQFLNNPSFSPVGSPIDLAILYGFVALIGIGAILSGNAGNTKEHTEEGLNTGMIASVVSVSIILIGLIFTVFQIMKPATSGITAGIALPPYRLSWYAAVESLKNPMSAVFGIGIGNFSSIFTSVKDAAYSRSDLWQIQSFTVARSALLHVLSTTGIFGLAAFLLLLLNTARVTFAQNADKTMKVLFIFLTGVLVLLPPSLMVMFLLFLFVGMTSYLAGSKEDHEGKVEMHLEKMVPLYAGIIVLAVLLLGATGYIVGRAYAAEIYFKKSLNGLVANSAQELYNNQRQAVVLNQYNDRFRISFSQTNLLIANNLAAQGNERELTDAERETIVQTIQAAIQEAKAAVILSPGNAGNWENLAVIYRNILNLAQGADSWTVASYQRAIALDPQNPSLWLNLGGVFYSLGNYEQAGRMFEQAATIKPDWPNALYNLAWAAEQQGDHASAAIIMQRVLTLVDPVSEEADYKRAQADFETFRAKIPRAPQPQSEGQNAPQQLSLPTPPAATLDPKLELPTEPQSPEPPDIPREGTPTPQAEQTNEATGSAQ